MELLVVLPAPSVAASPRTVALALEAGPEHVTVAALKAEIERQSARVYHDGPACCGSSSCCSHEAEGEEEEDGVLGGIPAALQRLTLGGRHLPDDRTLAECAVTEYVGIVVYMRYVCMCVCVCRIGKRRKSSL